jgi:uncharacterized protein YecT (DUF1311 family)
MFSVLIAVAAAAAQPHVDCNNALTTADTLYCAGRDRRIAEARLNRAYQAANAVMVSMDVDRNKTYDKRVGYHDALVTSQRAWLKFRETECVAEGYAARGGSMEAQLVAACLIELTEARTKQLQDLVKLYND